MRRISIFSGGFTSTAAHAIAAPEARQERVCQQLHALEAKGLVTRTGSERQERWSLLLTVAEYAAEQLAKTSEDEQIADRHLEWFAAYATQANTLLGQWSAHALIDHESANIRRALDRALERARPAAVAIAAGMMRHWLLAEHYEEARTVCAKVLSAQTANADAGSLALAHCGAGLVQMLSEDYQGAIASTRNGLTLAENLEDPKIMTDCLAMSSMVLIQTGLEVKEGLERAVELARRAQDPAGLTFALVNLAVALMLCERFDAVQSVYEEFLQMPGASGHPRLRTWAEQAAAWAQISVGSPARALEHAQVALDLEGDWPSMTYFQIIGFRIHALATMGRTGEALAEGDAAPRLANESGALQAVPAIELALTVAECMRGDFDAAAVDARRLLAMPQAHTLAVARDTLARSAILRGDTDEAHEHAAEIDLLAERSSSGRQHALADHIRGRAAIHTGNTSQARDRLHAALARYEQLGFKRDTADVLDDLAVLDVATARSKEARDSRGPPPRSAPSSVVSRFRAQPNSYKPLARRASPPAQQTAGMQRGRKGKNWRPRTQSPTRAGAAGRVPDPKPDGTASHRPRSQSLSSPPRE